MEIAIEDSSWVKSKLQLLPLRRFLKELTKTQYEITNVQLNNQLENKNHSYIYKHQKCTWKLQKEKIQYQSKIIL